MRVDRRGWLAGGLAALTIPGGGGAAAQDCALHIEVDTRGWTGLEAWTEALTPLLPGWWRAINAALGGTGCAAEKTVQLQLVRIKPDSVAAAARGDKVLINAPYVLANRGNADMLRMIAHELVHIAQAYPPGTGPGWLTERIADYVRYYVLFPDDRGAPSTRGRRTGERAIRRLQVCSAGPIGNGRARWRP